MRNSDTIYQELKTVAKEDFVKRLELATELSYAMHLEYPDKKK